MADPKGIQHGGFIRNGINERCWFTQIYEETNPHFMPPSLQHTTHHDLRTIIFDDPECMAGAYDTLNKMMINNAITRWLRGNYFVRDIEFDTQDILPPAEDQARGNCLQSTNYPSKGIYIEYRMDAGNITSVFYMEALDSCTGSGPANRVEAPAPPRSTPRPAQGQDYSVAEKLTVLEDPRRRDYDAVVERFQFLLDWFLRSCPDVTEEIRVGDFLVFIHQKLEGIGKREGLLALSSRLLEVAGNTSSLARGAKVDSLDCAEIFVMYYQLRQEGLRPEVARAVLTDTVAESYGVSMDTPVCRRDRLGEILGCD
ncbi:MAG: hypothetical protein OXH85_02460 [Truepera sp.]|nr:hypothetical protein [Truepera sp.]